jgi:YD repeat-containing protein
MKKIFFALFLLGSTTMFAQRNQPPSSVRESFQRDNPSRNARWKRENNNEWHATYRDANNRNIEAYYDRNGRMRETHTPWNRKDMPSDLDNRIYRMYHTRNYRAVKIDRPNDEALFQVSFSIGGKNRTVYLDAQGKSKTYRRY